MCDFCVFIVVVQRDQSKADDIIYTEPRLQAEKTLHTIYPERI